MHNRPFMEQYYWLFYLYKTYLQVWDKKIEPETASRNVAFKVAKMRNSIIIMEGQDELIICKSECGELGLEANTKAVLEDVGHNADLYIANQEDVAQSSALATNTNAT